MNKSSSDSEHYNIHIFLVLIVLKKQVFCVYQYAEFYKVRCDFLSFWCLFVIAGRFFYSPLAQGVGDAKRSRWGGKFFTFPPTKPATLRLQVSAPPQVGSKNKRCTQAGIVSKIAFSSTASINSGARYCSA